MSVRFNAKGSHIASGGHDNQICKVAMTSPFTMRRLVLWNVYGECENFMTLKGHSGPILELCWNADGRYSPPVSFVRSVCQ